MRYHITHETRYHYEAPVDLAQHQGFFRPRDLSAGWLRQRVLEHALHITPQPGTLAQRLDAFGNAAVFFAVQEPHAQLLVRSVSSVEVIAGQVPRVGGPPWEAVREALRGDVGEQGLSVCQFVFDSPMIAPHNGTAEMLRHYALQSFTPGRGVVDAGWDLCHRIHRDFAYKPGSTTVATALQDVWNNKRGVCQDFAHVMIAMVRSVGLPARYVSGYIRNDRPANDKDKLVGADASHAWVALWTGHGQQGGAGWLDMDPTNRKPAGEEHITVAWGRDFSDVSPLRGVLTGGGGHRVGVAVQVEPIKPEQH